MGTASGSEIGFGPDQEASVSPPSYEMLTQCDIVSVVFFSSLFYDSKFMPIYPQDVTNSTFSSTSISQVNDQPGLKLF